MTPYLALQVFEPTGTLVDSVRRHVTSQMGIRMDLAWLPVWFAIGLVIAWCILRWRRADPPAEPSYALPTLIPVIAAGYLLTAAVLYVAVPGYLDHLEPAMTIKALALTRGEPVYPALTDPARTQLVYGPSAYLAPSAIVPWFANPVTASKLSGVLCGLAGVVTLGLVWLRRRPAGHGRVALFYCVVSPLIFTHVIFRVQADSILFLGVAMATAAIAVGRPNAQAALWAIGVALAVAAKPHAGIYLVALLPVFVSQAGIRRVAIASGVAAILAALPFVLGPFDFRNALATVSAVSAGHDWSPEQLLRNLCVAAVMALPLAIRFWEQRSGLTAGATAFAVVTTCIVASKQGAGVHHLVPFAAVLPGLWWHSFGSSGDRSTAPTPRRFAGLRNHLLLAWLLAMLIQSGLIQQHYLSLVAFRQPYEASAEALRIRESLEQTPLRITFGFTDDARYNMTFIRPLFAPILQAHVLEPLAIADLDRAGLPLPSSTVALFANQYFDLVILPAQGIPFSMTNWYDRRSPLFGPALSGVFQANYHEHERFQYFAVWRADRCRTNSTTSGNCDSTK